MSVLTVRKAKEVAASVAAVAQHQPAGVYSIDIPVLGSFAASACWSGRKKFQKNNHI